MKPGSASEETTWERNGRMVYRRMDEPMFVLTVDSEAVALEALLNALEKRVVEAEDENADLERERVKLNKALREAEAKTALADDLAEQLRDCIAEVEGKAYLKPYVKAVYDEVLARYDALKASANGEEKNDG